jgi:diadenosine tetraphosphate (Ap4A) HIT family hydrolase
MPIELPQGNGCIFCDRIEGKRDDWAVVARNDLTVTFVGPRQWEEGQCLVIPRRHAPTVLDLTDDECAALMLEIRRIGRALMGAYDPDGLTVYQNNGVASLQEVPHAHFHVVPRRYGGGWGEGPPHIAPLTRAERDAHFERIATPIEVQAAAAERIRAALE